MLPVTDAEKVRVSLLLGRFYSCGKLAADGGGFKPVEQAFCLLTEKIYNAVSKTISIN
jgi:hypothetical protein